MDEDTFDSEKDQITKAVADTHNVHFSRVTVSVKKASSRRRHLADLTLVVAIEASEAEAGDIEESMNSSDFNDDMTEALQAATDISTLEATAYPPIIASITPTMAPTPSADDDSSDVMGVGWILLIVFGALCFVCGLIEWRVGCLGCCKQKEGKNEKGSDTSQDGEIDVEMQGDQNPSEKDRLKTGKKHEGESNQDDTYQQQGRAPANTGKTTKNDGEGQNPNNEAADQNGDANGNETVTAESKEREKNLKFKQKEKASKETVEGKKINPNPDQADDGTSTELDKAEGESADPHKSQIVASTGSSADLVSPVDDVEVVNDSQTQHSDVPVTGPNSEGTSVVATAASANPQDANV